MKLDPDTFANLRRPLLEASTLPHWCYTDEAFHAIEKERIFIGCWNFVGRVEQFEKVGSFRVFEGVGGSVIVVRSGQDSLRAFANSCRHRGARLVEDCGHTGRFTCPYHSWVYDLDGALRVARGMEDVKNFDREDFPLVNLPLETWEGFVFFNYNPACAPLADSLGNMPAVFGSHNLSDMVYSGSLDYLVDANWKLLAENALEAYHTGAVHGETLGQQASRPLDCEGDWGGIMVLDENSVGTLNGEPAPFPFIEGLSEMSRQGTYFTMLYPCTQFAMAQDCMWWMALYPLGVDRTRVEIGGCFPSGTTRDPAFSDKAARYFQRWSTATPEDNAICEAQHQGQRLPRDPGRFAPTEYAVHAHSNWVIDQLLSR